MPSPYTIKAKRFLLWWIIFSSFIWCLALPLGIWLIPIIFFPLLLTLIIPPILGALIGLFIAIFQRHLIYNRLYWEAEDWLRNSSIGGAIGLLVAVGITLALYYITDFEHADYYARPFYFYVFMPSFLFCISSAQTLSLRHAVGHSWLWVLGNLVGGIVFTGLVVDKMYFWFNEIGSADDYFLYPTIYLPLGVIVLGFITGFVLLFLFEKHCTLTMQAPKSQVKGREKYLKMK